MESDCLPTPKMDWQHPNRAQAFREFKQIAEIWFTVKDIAKEQQHNYIVLWSGTIGLCIFNTLSLTKDQLKDPENIWSKFSAQLEPVENFRIHRLEFQRFQQRGDDTVDDFFTRCKEKAGLCQFRDA